MKNIKSKLISIYVEALKEFKFPNQNIDGLSVIFSFWLDAIEYSIKKKKFISSSSNFDKENLPYLIKINENKNYTKKNFSKKRNFLLLRTLVYFFKFSKKFILWDIFNKKFNFLSTYLFFKNFIFFQININKELKKNFFLKFEKIKFSHKQKNYFKSLIPNFFFQKYDPIMKKKIIKLSSVDFLFDNRFTNIFFKIENPIIHGYQHGMGYDFFLNKKNPNKLSIFEKKISKKFFPLFPLGESFGRYNFKKKLKNNPKKIIWAQRRYITDFEKYILGDYGKNLSNLFFLKSLDKRLSKFNNLHYSLFNNDFLYKPKYTKRFHLKDKIENIVSQNDIIIFDTIAPTLLHFVLKNKINFIFIIENNLDFKLLNKTFKKLIRFFEKEKFLFRYSQFDEFKKEIDIMLKDNNYVYKKNNQLKKIYA